MKFLEEIKQSLLEKSLLRTTAPVSSPSGPEIILHGKKVLNFCSNDYLGLANHPALIEAAEEAMKKYGFGAGSARLIGGNCELHEWLEQQLGRWKEIPQVTLFNSGYHANVGCLPALTTEKDLLLCDELNHASIIDGCRLSKAKKTVFRHHDLQHLEEILCREKKILSPKGRIWIVTESGFSMEGSLSPLEEIQTLLKKHDAFLYLDEAHAVGVFGKHGKGRLETIPQNTLVVGTLGKAFGTYGAFVCGHAPLREVLMSRARTFLFTTALPPAVLAASLASLDLVIHAKNARKQLHEWMTLFGTHSPIVSLQIGDAEKTMRITKELYEEGIYLHGIRPPTVPEGTSRLRLTLMANHTKEHLVFLKSLLKKTNLS